MVAYFLKNWNRGRRDLFELLGNPFWIREQS